jgi:hypothetical protein
MCVLPRCRIVNASTTGGPVVLGFQRVYFSLAGSGTMHVCEAARGYVVFSLFMSNERVAFTREFGP